MCYHLSDLVSCRPRTEGGISVPEKPALPLPFILHQQEMESVPYRDKSGTMENDLRGKRERKGTQGGSGGGSVISKDPENNELV